MIDGVGLLSLLFVFLMKLHLWGQTLNCAAKLFSFPSTCLEIKCFSHLRVQIEEGVNGGCDK